MRVALISPGPVASIGGVERVVWAVASRLARAEHSVEVWEQAPKALGPATTVREGVTIRTFPGLGPPGFQFSPALWQHVRRHSGSFDILHAHNYHSTVLATSLVAADVTIVLSPHFHGGGHTPLASILHRPYRPVARRALRRADRIVAVSRAERTLFEKHFPDLPHDVDVIRNGVDSDDIMKAVGFAQESPILLVLGRHEEYKRIDLVIDGFSGSTAPGTLVILGDGPARIDLERQAARSPRAAEIRFLGVLPRKEVLRWLRSARAIASLSEHEASGLVALEALTAGAHAVLSAIPAHIELSQDTNSAAVRVVKPDPKEVAAAFDAVLASPSRAPEMIRDWDQAADEYQAVYQAATQGSPPSHHDRGAGD